MISGKKTFGAYYYHAAKEDHDYGEIISSIKFEEKVFEEIEDNHFIEGLANYLMEKQSDIVDQRKMRSDAYKKAKKIYRRKSSGTGVDTNQAIKLVENAIEEGYIWDFRLEEPWHPKMFVDENRLTTFPFQHKFMVGYSAKPKHIFFHQQGKERVQERVGDVLTNPDSVLSQGRLRGGTVHPSTEYSNDETNDNAIWFTCLRGTFRYPQGVDGSKYYDYDDNVVLEIEVPSRFVVQHHKDHVRWETREDLLNNFKNPKEYRRRILEEWEDTDSYDFKVALRKSQSEGKAFLPLEYILGFWDRDEFPNTPHFMPIDEYASLIRKRFPEKVPPPSKCVIDYKDPVKGNLTGKNKKKLELKEEIRETRKLTRLVTQSITSIESWGGLNYSGSRLSNIGKELDVISEINKYHNGHDNLDYKGRMVDLLEDLNENVGFLSDKIQLIRRKFQEIVGRDLEPQKEINLRELYQNQEEGKDLLKQKQEDIKTIGQDLIKKERNLYDNIEDISIEEAKKEMKEIEEELAQEITEIPLIEVDGKDVEYVSSLMRNHSVSEEQAREIMGQVAGLKTKTP